VSLLTRLFAKILEAFNALRASITCLVLFLCHVIPPVTSVTLVWFSLTFHGPWLLRLYAHGSLNVCDCGGLSKPCALRSVALRDCESSASYFSFELNFRCLSKTPSAIALLRELQRASIVCFTGRGKSDLVLKLVKPHQSLSTDTASWQCWHRFQEEPILVFP
jgi:hypothetical protein